MPDLTLGIKSDLQQMEVLMKSIKWKVMMIILFVFTPFLISLLIAFSTFSSLSYDGVSINLAGSQRMRTMLLANYSQQLKDALLENNSVKETAARDVLELEYDKYESITISLIEGNQAYGIRKTKIRKL